MSMGSEDIAEEIMPYLKMAMGVDVGLKNQVTTSTGESIPISPTLCQKKTFPEEALISNY